MKYFGNILSESHFKLKYILISYMFLFRKELLKLYILYVIKYILGMKSKLEELRGHKVGLV